MTPLNRAYIGFAVIGAVVLGAFLYEQTTGQSLQDLGNPLTIQRSVTPEGTVKVPEMLPVFSLKDLNQQTIASSRWQGHPLIINFWASWCAPCRHEIPLLNDTAQHPSVPELQVVGIAIDFKEDVEKFIKQTPLSYPLLIGEEDGLEVARSFGVDSLAFPFTIFADSQGHVLAVRLGELHPEALKQALALLGALENHQLTLADARQQITAALNVPTPAPH
jgi:thiol-disulfide isomerase/thioredoxin